MEPEKKPTLSPEWMMVLSVLAASTGAIFIRFAQRDAPSLVIAAYRLGIGTLVLAPFALIGHWRTIQRFRRQEWFLSIVSGIFLALHFATWITSLEYTTVASSVVLVSMSPLLVALLSTFILREPLARTGWIGLAVALIGSMLVAFNETGGDTLQGWLRPVNGTQLLGNLLAFSGAVFVAGYIIIGRKLRASLALTPYAFIVFGTAALALLLAAVVSGEKLGGYPPVTYLWFLMLGLIPQILGHAGFNWALRFLPASFVAIALLGEPIGSSLMALFFLGETPSVLEILGGLMILTGIYLASRRR